MLALTRARLQQLRNLQHQRGRVEQGHYLIEGHRLVEEALGAGVVSELFATEAATAVAAALIASAATTVTPITPVQAEQLSGTPSPQGIFALVPLPSTDPPKNAKGPVLILDGVSDPGNVGTLLRSASWFGVRAVWSTPETASFYNPKVVRAGMGAHFRLETLWQGDTEAVARAAQGLALFAATTSANASAAAPLADSENWALVVGSEAKGVSPVFVEQCEREVTIRRQGKGESLNAAVAGSIILYLFTGGAQR